MDILGTLGRTLSLILSILEPLIDGDVLSGLLIMLVLIVFLGQGE